MQDVHVYDVQENMFRCKLCGCDVFWCEVLRCKVVRCILLLFVFVCQDRIHANYLPSINLQVMSTL